MTPFLLGCASSITAVFIVWLARDKIIPEVRRRFFTGIPTVQGTYDLIKLSYDNPHKPDDDADVKTVMLRQTGSKVSGVLITSTKEKCALIGSITGSRLLTFSWEPLNKNIHDYGTAVLKLDVKGADLSGVVTFLCECCEEITPTRVIMKKKDDPPAI